MTSGIKSDTQAPTNQPNRQTHKPTERLNEQKTNTKQQTAGRACGGGSGKDRPDDRTRPPSKPGMVWSACRSCRTKDKTETRHGKLFTAAHISGAESGGCCRWPGRPGKESAGAGEGRYHSNYCWACCGEFFYFHFSSSRADWWRNCKGGIMR